MGSKIPASESNPLAEFSRPGQSKFFDRYPELRKAVDAHQKALGKEVPKEDAGQERNNEMMEPLIKTLCKLAAKLLNPMTHQQKIILVGCILIGVMVLVPPYLLVSGNGNSTYLPTRFIGYHAFASPPNAEKYYSAQIDGQRLTLQIVAAVLITAGLAFAFRPNAKSE